MCSRIFEENTLISRQAVDVGVHELLGAAHPSSQHQARARGASEGALRGGGGRKAKCASKSVRGSLSQQICTQRL
jgi:hypothetical protein